MLDPFVLCIHSFASSSRQYRSLAQRLAPRFRVVTADLYGHGGRAPWNGAWRFTLADEAARFEALLPEKPPVHLVGHSYGAAVALRIAATNRTRVRSMVLYEPALWGTLAELCPGEPATLEIEAVRDETIRLLDAGRLEAAAERFIDYWTGAGAWAATPAERRPRLLAAIRSLRDGWVASFTERWSMPALRSLDIPCLLLTGTRSTAAARRALALLRDALPRAQVLELDGLGHLGPISHPGHVDAAVEAFLREYAYAVCGHCATPEPGVTFGAQLAANI
jgi:pimeloyl-ACP methyl ester carboxylesterase